MSDLLIRGMELPENCWSCRMFCNCFACEGHDCHCAALGKDIGIEAEVPRNKRRDDCPLVPAPAHGRLIDVDKVLDDLAHNLGIRSLDYLTPSERAIVSWFRDAPTIIPAEPCNNLSKPCKKEAAP